MTRQEIEQLADKRYPTAKDIDASLTTMAERNGWRSSVNIIKKTKKESLLGTGIEE